MTEQAREAPFEIIRQRGDPDKATTLHGERVERKKAIFIQDWHLFVNTAPYDDHFVYWTDEVGQSSLMCTCGSSAVIMTDGPMMVVCLMHASTGQHATGGTRWV